jgi:DNA-binding response OmpR family regulator
MLKNNPFANVDVLLLEPNTFMRGLVRNILHELGVRRIREASDTHTAIAAFKSQAADLVIADWSPDMDSLWLIKSLRSCQESPYPYVPVIAMSGYTEVNTVCEARDLGVDWYLAKPLSARVLRAHMLAAVRRRRAFIAENSYFGPDRRRPSADILYTGRERRLAAQAA